MAIGDAGSPAPSISQAFTRPAVTLWPRPSGADGRFEQQRGHWTTNPLVEFEGNAPRDREWPGARHATGSRVVSVAGVRGIERGDVGFAVVPSSHETTLLAVRVIPRAKRDEVGGRRAGRLIVRTTASPVDGRANVAVCKLVAEHLGVPARHVTIESGQRSRDKILRIVA